MISHHSSLLFLLLLGTSLPLLAALPRATQDAIDAVLLTAAQTAHVGCILEDKATGERLYELNPLQRSTPASCQKLLTTQVAFQTLGPAFIYKTILYASASDELTLLFSGDPTLTRAYLKTLLEAIPAKSAFTKLVLRDPLPIIPDFNETWMLEDCPSPYCSAISGSSIDKSMLEARINYTTFENQPTISLNASYPYQNALNTNPNKIDVELRWENQALRVGGSIAPGLNVVIEKIGVPNASLNTQLIVSEILKEIKRPLNIRSERGVPISIPAQKLATHVSKPLSEILISAFQFSNNFTYDTLFLTLAALKNPHFTSWDEAATAFKALAQEVLPSIDLKAWQVNDGSGLSLKNWVSPELCLELFKLAEKNPDTMAALAVSGEPGTLQHRFNDFPGTVRGKTGRLSGTSNFVGLIEFPHAGPIWRYIIFVNQGEIERESAFGLPQAVVRAIKKASGL